jgi:hypothetical protein
VSDVGLVLAFVWGGLMVTTAWLASARGHGIVTWVLLALFVTPILAIPMLLSTPRKVAS